MKEDRAINNNPSLGLAPKSVTYASGIEVFQSTNNTSLPLRAANDNFVTTDGIFNYFPIEKTIGFQLPQEIRPTTPSATTTVTLILWETDWNGSFHTKLAPYSSVEGWGMFHDSDGQVLCSYIASPAQLRLNAYNEVNTQYYNYLNMELHGNQSNNIIGINGSQLGGRIFYSSYQSKLVWKIPILGGNGDVVVLLKLTLF